MKKWGILVVCLLMLGGCGGEVVPAETKATVKQIATSVGTDAVHGFSGDDTASAESVGDVRLVDDAKWVERDGVTALVVTPSKTLRQQTSSEVFDEAWRRVVAAVPEADTPGMKDQFVCHASFAPNKEGWFLEPARPAVGYWETVKAGCNPGDVTDVG